MEIKWGGRQRERGNIGNMNPGSPAVSPKPDANAGAAVNYPDPLKVPLTLLYAGAVQ